MSIFGRGSTFQGLKFSSMRLWSEDCALCLNPVSDRCVCAACRAALPHIANACERCALALPEGRCCGGCMTSPPAFDDAVAAFEYRFPLDRLVQRFKYAGDLALGHWLALELAGRLAPLERPDLLVVPPLSRVRLRDRGFNQALEIARRVGRVLAVPVSAGAVRRVRETTSQARLRESERRANLARAFTCAADLRGRHVAVVDDVLTTGATADALARTLKGAGAARVSAWVVARVPEPLQR